MKKVFFRYLILLFFISISDRLNAQSGIVVGDEPWNPIVLTELNQCVEITIDPSIYTISTIVGAPGCAGNTSGSENPDVWLLVTVPENGNLFVSPPNVYSSDPGLAVYRFDPSTTEYLLLGCDDDAGPGLMPRIDLTGLIPGEFLYLRYWLYHPYDIGSVLSCGSGCNTASLYFSDNDSDGYGNTNQSGFLLCQPSIGFVSNSFDCDDQDSSIFPGSIEICSNGIDEDCTGSDSICLVLGCLDTAACNYNANATDNYASCNYPSQTYLNCDGSCINDTDADGVCNEIEVPGCTDLSACNYNATATDENASCIYPSHSYLNCDGSCINDTDADGVCNEIEVPGCTDPSACNFNATATDDNASCIYPSQAYLNCDGSCINDTDIDGVCDQIEISGCTDSTAFNFNPQATNDDGSCVALLTCNITAPTTTLCAGESVNLSISATGGAGSSSQLPANLQQGLVAYYPFNGNANDESGNGNNGVVNGATLTSDRFGNVGSAYGFDGNDYVAINQSAQIQFGQNGNFTYSTWFIAPSEPSQINDFRFFAAYASTDIQNLSVYPGGFQLGLNNPNHQILLELGSTPAELFYGSNGVESSGWHHFSISVNRDVDLVRVYLDGQEIGSRNIPNSYNYTPCCDSKLLIGGERIFNPSHYFIGSIDEVIIYNRALSPSEIQQLYTSQSYAWSTGATTSSITVSPTTNTTYSCTVTSGSQTCTASVDIIVTPQQTFYADADGDGFGNINAPQSSCEQPAGFVSNANDCNDNEVLAFVGATDICGNGIDEDCSGADSTCIVLGCININACNFNALANTDDGSCSFPAENYLNCDGNCLNDADADGVCDEIEVNGCTDNTAFNYNPSATNDDGSCEAILNCEIVSSSNDLCIGESVSLGQQNIPFTPTGVKSFQSDAVFQYNVDQNLFSPTAIQNNFSYDFWVNPTSTIGAFPASAQGCSFSSLNLSNSGQKWILFPVNNGNDLGLGVSVGTNGVLLGTHAEYHLSSRLPFPINMQGWNHIAITVANKNIELYINGNLVASMPNTSSCELRPSFSLGVNLEQGLYGRSFIGKFANVRVWNAPLSAAEVNFVKDKELINGYAGDKVFYRLDIENLTSLGSSNLNVTNYGTPILQDFTLDGGSYLWNGSIDNSVAQQNTQNEVLVNWSTGSLTQNINASPTQTTEYFVTVSTSTQTCTDSITITVNPLLDWYADVDGDGFGNPNALQSACEQPVGFVSNANDCNDNEALAYIGATDICDNGIDEDCSGTDSTCIVLGCTDVAAINFNPEANTDDGSCIAVVLGCTDAAAFNYNAAANTDDGSCIPVVLGCTNSGACNFNELANTDDDSCVLPQTETCNGLDDNCDGQVDEGLTLGSVTATPVSTNVFPTCSGNALKSANLNNGANSPIIDGNGLDLWYSLTAQYNTLRASLSAAFGDNEIRLYSYNNGCFELMETEHEVYTASTAATGNQVLITDDLLVGQTYYIAVHNISGPMNSSAKMCFNHFVGSTCDHYYSNNTGIYPNVCTSFKAQYKGNATNYIFDILSATQNNANLNITPWSYTTTTANSVVPRLGTIFPVNMSNAAKVYTMRIPVIYAIPDAAGNYTSITANATTTCTVTLNAELPIALRASDRCPNTKTTTSSISVDRTICGAQRYEWEFTQQLPSVQSPVTVLGGLNTTVFFLNNVPGMGTGKTYNVRVRPIHTNGEVGNWGTAQCLKTGTSGMVMQSESDNESGVWANNYSPEQAVTLYPNPTSTGHFTLMSNASEEEVKQMVITDITGKVVFQSQVVMNGNSVDIEFGDLATGMYLVMVGEERLRLVVE